MTLFHFGGFSYRDPLCFFPGNTFTIILKRSGIVLKRTFGKLVIGTPNIQNPKLIGEDEYFSSGQKVRLNTTSYSLRFIQHGKVNDELLA
jgi:hypothetical protein